jgi:hypothetical protein
VIFLSQDDKAWYCSLSITKTIVFLLLFTIFIFYALRVAIGVVAANKQAPILIHLKYQIHLPDHDWVVDWGTN